MPVIRVRAFYWQVIQNFFTLVEKDNLCHDIFLQIIFDAKTGHSIYYSLSVTSCTYVRIILTLISLASFWRRKKTFLFLFCVGTLPLWMQKSWFLILYLMMISRSTWSTNNGSCIMGDHENDIGINYQTVESNLFFRKMSWLHFAFRSQSKILWKIKLNVLAIVSFFHQRKNRGAVTNICSIFKIRITRMYLPDTLTDIFDRFKIIN